MEVANEVCDLLQTHANRDKVVSLTCYTLKLWGSTTKSPALLTASGWLATTRATMRLFDDAAALKVALNYGFGEQDGPVWGTIGAAGSAFTLAYLQAEKLVWLIDTGLLVLDKDLSYRIKTTHKLFWSLYSFVGFVRSIRALHATALAVQSPSRTKCASARLTQATLTSTKLFLDVVHAVSWLPRGWLWGDAITTQHASAVATTAAALGIVLHYHGKRLQP